MDAVKNKAEHIYYMGSGMVRNEIVHEVLIELEKYPGVYYEGISDHGVTVIERVND